MVGEEWLLVVTLVGCHTVVGEEWFVDVWEPQNVHNIHVVPAGWDIPVGSVS